ncbi:hypothetical protein FNF29_06954 [Cafeteria roenbergensis]|uniref:Uncharacterized protein n=1 Tax=Cafeteria roenbergensis TaxID=33653 RepID=A0A5A8C7D3_CAFRO|nr:hypothetical protein FNF29_06954 [Cafeteria roenbergensis]|eukprot:KAA0148010.1 hypothetical protein FNF29_06954 [Cafeteria roenbergensis]
MAVSIVFNTATDAGLAELNEFMVARSYLVGFSATQADVALVAAIGKCPSADKFPHLARYYNHINALTAAAKGSLAAGLVISAVVEDEKTSLTDIEEEIESWEEVGSLDQLDMQKVT